MRAGQIVDERDLHGYADALEEAGELVEVHEAVPDLRRRPRLEPTVNRYRRRPVVPEEEAGASLDAGGEPRYTYASKELNGIWR